MLDEGSETNETMTPNQTETAVQDRSTPEKIGITKDRIRELRDQIAKKRPDAEKVLRKGKIDAKNINHIAIGLLRQDFKTRNELDPKMEELEKGVEEAEKQAMVDNVTGLPNHRWLTTELNARIAESTRTNQSFWLLMSDIDDFKKVNSVYGQPGGDRILGLIKFQEVRKEEPIARSGGEEFVQLTRETTSQEEIARIIERQIASINNNSNKLLEGMTPIEHGNKQIYKITLSYGAARYEIGETVEDLLKRANLAMLKAKKSGKNKGFIATKENGEIIFKEVINQESAAIAV